jgi:polysaccharide biosynthesis/export protein
VAPRLHLPTAVRAAALALAVLGAAGCWSPKKLPAPQVFGTDDPALEYREIENEEDLGVFKAQMDAASNQYASPDEVAAFSGDTMLEYRMGPGDVFSFLVRGRPDISMDSVVVSPDGHVALPRVGIVRVQGRTLRDVTDQLVESLRRFYDSPDVTLAMREFNNNKVYVLGRVANPGAVRFTGQGTLLEALSLAGGLPADTARSFLTRCVVMRGNERILWIDLKDLLEGGNMALNPRLQNGDFIYIPQSEDQMAYVMGEVLRPGVLLLRNEMTVMDAIMQSGGLAKTANPGQIHLVRTADGRGVVQNIDVQAMIDKGDFRQNYVLRTGDIVYVGERTASKFNYFLAQFFPSMRVVDFTLDTAERFGAMAELRELIWGQEGFINASQ